MTEHTKPNESGKNNQISGRIRAFLATESASGMLMIICTFLALAIANSPLSELYKNIIDSNVSFSVGSYVLSWPLQQWIQDVLMVFFFLLVGLELKRETSEGLLSQRKQIALPFAAAIGGMVVPALIFCVINSENPNNLNGWAIPSATDIAFALAILNIFGKNVPSAAKVFLLAIAIFDDLGAVIIIAIFYNSGIAPLPVSLAILGIAGLFFLGKNRVPSIVPYALVGLFLWFCFHEAGIHTTLAGVATGLAIPTRTHDRSRLPLNKLMHFLHPWVSFLILPLFAIASAGVDLREISIGSMFSALPLGIAAGLFFGKQIGIFGTTWLMVKCNLAERPAGVCWRNIYAISVIAGVGFTMSLFIGALAFKSTEYQEMVKLGVIGGSFLCVLWAVLVFRLFPQLKTRQSHN